MSAKHPIISVTGSSGAGTTSVRQTFENIFRREHITAAFIEGDAFHRYGRAEMDQAIVEARLKGNNNFSHFGEEANLLSELEEVFRSYGESGRGRTRNYIHDEHDAELHGAPIGTFTKWHDLPRGTDLLFYEGLHGAVVTPKVNVAMHADLKIGVVPVINLEWIQKLIRDKSARGYSHDEAVEAILTRMPDYVNFICPQFTETDINFQRVPTVDTSNPFVARWIPTPDEFDGHHPLPRPARYRLPVSAVDDADELHVARQLDRHPRRQTRSCHAADPNAAYSDPCRGQATRLVRRFCTGGRAEKTRAANAVRIPSRANGDA